MTDSNAPVLCDARESALVVVDVQVRLTAGMPAKVLARLQRNMSLLLKAASILEVPVFASEQYPQGLGGLEPEILQLLPASARRYEKTAFSLTDAAGFLSDLSAGGRRQIVLAGMEAHISILQTALRLAHDGYRAIVVADAVCSRQRESYETALARLRQEGVPVCDAESVVFEWMRDAKHEHFKAIHTLLR